MAEWFKAAACKVVVVTHRGSNPTPYKKLFKRTKKSHRSLIGKASTF